ncbi:MAG: hypothetical protein JSW45_07670 [Thiotrichales bacterium]|nr:MAG: hypothetical protein JSW45_07670 [Thiotrichales bacterium]
MLFKSNQTGGEKPGGCCKSLFYKFIGALQEHDRSLLPGFLEFGDLRAAVYNRLILHDARLDAAHFESSWQTF